MTTTPSQEYSSNERELALLLGETGDLKNLLAAALEEVSSLQEHLAAQCMDPYAGKAEEDIEFLLEQLDDYESQSKEYLNKLHNHKYDLQGMRECDDVSCESFFQAEHLQLKKDVQEFITRFNCLKNQLLAPHRSA